MDVSVERFLPILFSVLAGFIALNIIINFTLLYIRRQHINLLLAIYWPLLLVIFLMQSRFQEGILPTTLAFSGNFFPVCIIAAIGFNLISANFPYKRYLFPFLFAWPVTLVAFHLGFRFELMALPFALSVAWPILDIAWHVLVLERERTTKLQKLFAIVCIGGALNSFNFALFRMVPGAQLWGWLLTYAVYDAAAIVLPSIALENAYLTEKERLEKQIAERTAELDKSLEDNRGLLKILLHDIYNPLSSMGMYLRAWEPRDEQGKTVASGLSMIYGNLRDIVGSVKGLYLNDDSQPKLKPLLLKDCCQELYTVFSAALKEKDVSLNCRELAPGIKVLGDRALFVHSVLCNLVSNALKFSPPGSVIELTAAELDSNVIIEVKDQGHGMSANIIDSLEKGAKIQSGLGTRGEKGTGLGLSIVKSIVQTMGGRMEILGGMEGRGTVVRLILPKASEGETRSVTEETALV